VAKNKHIGSSFDSFLVEQGMHDEVTAVAMKRVISWQIVEAMKQSGITKVAMAARMQTSRSLLDRLLDPEDAGLTLDTLTRAASALNLRIHLELRQARREPVLRR
jgi:antitoxin HicB